MTRSNPDFLHQFDPEIDRTFHRLIREHIIPPLDSHSHSHSHSDSLSVTVASELDSIQIENMGEQPYNGPRERTLREMAALDFTYESLCIQYPEEDVPFVLKIGLIHLLPKFHGHMLLQYFYEGLNNMERSMIDAASGGAIGDMTPTEARHLIEKMASNSQQFSTRNDNAIVIRRVHDVATDTDKKLERVNEHPEAYAANIYNRPPVPTNPKNVSAITLRSGKQIDIPTLVPPPPASAPVPVPVPTFSPNQNDEQIGARNFHAGGPSSSTNSDLIPLPFPPKLIPSKKMEEVDKEILETFKKVEVNIPLLDAIKQIPRYAKFLKDLCTHKRKLKGNERINMGRNVSTLIGKSIPHIPEKCKDLGTFCVPCIIGNSKFENAMLDLGASINVMPLSIFNSLSLGPMQPTSVVIQLENRSVAHPIGFIEDVLVWVGELIFPADFYVLDMEEGFSHGSAPIILGRPFWKTTRTKIDVYAGTLSMEFGDNIVHFNILDATLIWILF
uniref:DUF6738 domain-containing protein n=1 Tax=Cajanus cajan TaxID=3821 RepID=A0A151QS43_CAJCA|nr:hypothetical protein KK1_046039 [Cajanus cajan]